MARPVDEIKRAVQIGLIEQAIGFPSKKSKAHGDVMRSLVNRDKDNKFFDLDLATVDEALRLLHLSKTEVNKKSFDKAVKKIGMRDRIVKDAASKCNIKLDRSDIKQLNQKLVPAMTRPGALQKDLERHIRGMLIGRDVEARMEVAGLPVGQDSLNLMQQLFDPEGSLRNDVGFVMAHEILCELVESKKKAPTITSFSNELAVRKVPMLKPAQKVEDARVWMEYEVKTFRGEGAGATVQRSPLIGANRPIETTAEEDTGATVQPEDAVNSFLGEPKKMGMHARIGRAAFHQACVVHFHEPVQKALGIVMHPPLTAEKFQQALKELLDPAKVSQEFANLLLAARGEIHDTHLRDRFDWNLVQQGVYLFEVYAKRLRLTEDARKCIDTFLQILRIAADRPDEEEEEGRHPDIALITEARAAYKTFADTVVDRGVPELKQREQWLKDNRERIIAKGFEDSPNLRTGVSQEVAADAVEKAVLKEVSRGSDAEDLERAAHGALIGLDVLDRVRRVRLKQGATNYNNNELMSLAKVTSALFDPKGKHCDVDLATAHRVLRSFADVGAEISMKAFIEAMTADKASSSPRGEKAEAVRAWMRQQVKAHTKQGGASQSEVPAEIPGWAALRSVGEAHFVPIVQQALLILESPPKFDPKSTSQNDITKTVNKFNAIMALLLGGPDPQGIDVAVAKLPKDFSELYGVARSELDKAHFAPGSDPDKQKAVLLSEFDAQLFVAFISGLFEEANAKDPSKLKNSEVDNFRQLLDQVSSEKTGPYPPAIKEALDTWRAALRTFTGKLAGLTIGDRPPTKDWTDAILKVRNECGIETNVFALPIYDASGKLVHSNAKELVEEAMKAWGAAKADGRKRAAQGALIKHDLLVRVRQARERRNEISIPRYSDKEQEEFDSVMASLFKPGGKHCNIDIKTAHAVLCFFADDGLPVSRAEFIKAMADDDGDTFLSLAAFRKATAAIKNGRGDAEVRYSDGYLHIKAGIATILKKLGTSSKDDRKQTRQAIENLLNTHDKALGQPVIKAMRKAMKESTGWTDGSPVTVADIAKIEQLAIELKQKTARLPQGYWEKTFKDFCDEYGEIDPKIFNEEHREELARNLKDFATDAPDATDKEIKRLALGYLFQIAEQENFQIPDDPSRPEQVAISRYVNVLASLFSKNGMQYGKHYDVDIGAARSALKLLRTEKLEVNQASFDQALKVNDWIAKNENAKKAISNTLAECGIDPGTVVSAVKAKQNMVRLMMHCLPVDAPKGQWERAAQVAVLQTLLPTKIPKGATRERIMEVVEAYAEVLRSLITAEGEHRDLDIKLAYAAFKWLARPGVNVDSKIFIEARAAVETQSWFDRNIQKTLALVCRRCGIERKSFSEETIRQVIAVVSSKNAGATERELERATQGSLIWAALWKNDSPKGVDNLMRSLFEPKGTRVPVDFALAYAVLSDGNVDETSFDDAKVRLKVTTAGQRSIWAQEYCKREAIKGGLFDRTGFPQSQAVESITKEVLTLPYGVTEDDLQRAADGLVIAHKLLERVKETRQKWEPPFNGYNPAEQKSFQDVMRSVFHPDGEHHGVDIDTAYEALCSFADLGEQMTPDTFIERTQAIEVAGLSLEDKAVLVQQWIRQEIKVRNPGDQAEASPPTYLADSDVDGFLRGNQSASKKEDSRSVKARAALRSLAEPFFEDRVNNAVKVLQRPKPFDFKATDKDTVVSTLETFHEAMQRLLGFSIDETVKHVVYALPPHLCDLVRAGSTAVDEARFDPALTPAARLEQLKKVHERFNTMLALQILNPMLVDAGSKNGGERELTSKGLLSFTALLEKVANEATPEEDQYDPAIQGALAGWRGNYIAFVTSMIERGRPIET